MKHLLYLIAIGLVAQHANAVVVSGTNVTLTEISPTEYSLTVLQEPDFEETSIWFSFDGTTLAINSFLLDEGSDWYVTQSGDRFEKNTIAGDEFPIFLVSTSTDFELNPIELDGNEIYLGFSTGVGFDPVTDEGARNVYGWVQLRSTFGDFMIVDNAVAYGEGGIIIGTTTPIPEPSTLPLLLSCLAVVATRRRRASRPRSWPPTSRISSDTCHADASACSIDRSRGR